MELGLKLHEILYVGYVVSEVPCTFLLYTLRLDNPEHNDLGGTFVT